MLHRRINKKDKTKTKKLNKKRRISLGALSINWFRVKFKEITFATYKRVEEVVPCALNQSIGHNLDAVKQFSTGRFRCALIFFRIIIWLMKCNGPCRSRATSGE